MLQPTHIIGGRHYAAQWFDARSPFYKDVSAKIPDARLADAEGAVSFARNSQAALRNYSIEERTRMIHEAARHLSPREELVQYAVQMMGMPSTQMRNFSAQVPDLFKWMPEQFRLRYPLLEGNRYIAEIPNADQLEIREPMEGYAYSVVPGNDPRATAFVLSVLVPLGIPAVLKVSKYELPIALEIVDALTAAGYPKNAINVLCWDTSDRQRSAALNAAVARYASFIMPFGSDTTVNETLRVGPNGEDNFAPFQKDGTYGEKRVLSHPSGRCAAILDEQVTDDAIRKLVSGAFDYPISCKSTKALYVVGDAEKIWEQICSDAEKLVVGDPMDRKTNVGYIEGSTLDHVFGRLDLGKMHGSVARVRGKRVSSFSQTPAVVRTDDPLSEGLCYETPAYILTVKAAESLDEAIALANEAAGYGNGLRPENKRLTVSVFSSRPDDEIRKVARDIHASHRKINEPTLGLKDFALHQGNDYVRLLTRASTVSW